MQLIILGILWQLSELVMPAPQISKAADSSRFWHGHRWSGVCESFPEWLWDAASHSVYCSSAKTPNTCSEISWWTPKLTLQDPNCLGGRVCMRWKKAGILLSLPFLIPIVTTVAVVSYKSTLTVGFTSELRQYTCRSSHFCWQKGAVCSWWSVRVLWARVCTSNLEIQNFG